MIEHLRSPAGVLRPKRLGVALVALATLASMGLSSVSGAVTHAQAKTHGAAIEFGTVSEDTGGGVSPDTANGVTLGVRYVNETGGIFGHPVTDSRCDDGGSSTIDTTCVNNFIHTKKFIGIVTGATAYNGPIGIPAYEAAKMPVIDDSASASAQWNSTVSLDVVGGIGTTEGILAEHFHALKLKKVDVAWIDVTAVSSLVTLYDHFGAKLGEHISSTPISPTVTDFTATAVAIEATGAHAVFIIEGVSQNVSLVQALRSTNYKGIISVLPDNINSTSVAAMGSDASGVLAATPFAAPSTLKGATKTVYVAYEKLLTASHYPASSANLAGFVGVLAARAAIEQVPGGYSHLTRASFLKVLLHGTLKNVPFLPAAVSRSLAPKGAAYTSLANPTGFLAVCHVGGSITSSGSRIAPFSLFK